MFLSFNLVTDPKKIEKVNVFMYCSSMYKHLILIATTCGYV